MTDEMGHLAWLMFLPDSARAARTREGLSYEDVSRATGLSKSVIHKFEHGGNVRYRTVVTLARWLEDPDGRHDPS